MSTKGSQILIPVEDLDMNIPDSPVAEITQDVIDEINLIFPAHAIDVDEEGVESLGDVIPNGTLRQRLVCNHLTTYAILNKRQSEEFINKQPVTYNPASVDSYGLPIQPNSNVGKSFYIIHVLLRDKLMDAFKAIKLARQTLTGNTFPYPNGEGITPSEYNAYFQPVDV